MFCNQPDKYEIDAALYKQLANYYKYNNPQKHIEYYLKHYDAVQKLAHTYYKGGTSACLSPRQIQPAKIRILHASPNTPAIDVHINSQQILQNMNFKQYSDYITLLQGQYRIDIYISKITPNPVLSAIIPVMSDNVYTIAISGEVNNPQLISLIDNTYLPYGQAKIRVVHVSPDTSIIDIAIKDSELLFTQISFKQATDYLQASPGTANLEVCIAGTKESVLSLPNTKIDPNKIYTIFVVGYTHKTPKLDALFLTN
ncbi:MAG: DUF4397 domain-containing protein [Ectobacillus sp.]